MSNLLFPDLRGLAWVYTLAPMFSTGVQQATGGREVRAAFWSAPLWKISLTYSYMHDDGQHVDSNGYSELQQLLVFSWHGKDSSIRSLSTSLSSRASHWIRQSAGSQSASATAARLAFS